MGIEKEIVAKANSCPVGSEIMIGRKDKPSFLAQETGLTDDCIYKMSSQNGHFLSLVYVLDSWVNCDTSYCHAHLKYHPVEKKGKYLYVETDTKESDVTGYRFKLRTCATPKEGKVQE
jgi:hypothetical protein